VERAHDFAVTTSERLAGIREAAGRAFGEHIPTWEELLRRAHSATDPRDHPPHLLARSDQQRPGRSLRAKGRSRVLIATLRNIVEGVA
jgi:hypothetical protein